MSLLAILFTVFFATISSLIFYAGLNYSVVYFQSHHQLIFFLPFVGLLIVFLNQNQYRIKFKFMIVITTLLSHLFGASMGREHTVILIGKNVGQKISNSMSSLTLKKWLPSFGAASAFSAILGQPLSSLAFISEDGLLPGKNISFLLLLIISAFCSSFFGSLFIQDRLHFDGFIYNLDFSFSSIAVQFLLALLFYLLVKGTEFFQKKSLFPYAKMFVLAVLYMALVYSFGLYDYGNLSIDLLRQTFQNPEWIKSQSAFGGLIKYGLSGLCLAAGFAGGEFTISLVIGTLLGLNLYPLIQNWAMITAYEFYALSMIYYMAFKMRKPLTGLLLCFEFFNFSFAVGSLPIFIFGFLFRGANKKDH